MTITYRSVKGSDLTPAEADANTADLDARTPASQANAAASKNTPVDADEIPLGDSAASFGLKKLTVSNLKALLNTLYAALAGSASQAFSTAALTVAGLLDISGAAAGQIKFPATQNASSNANTLDDYEEGTWTPTDQSGAALSLTIVHATYIKIGKQVFIDARITYPTTANGSTALLGGLPFAMAGTVAFASNAYGVVGAYSVSAQAASALYPYVSNAPTPNSTFSATTLSITGCYQATA